jgi:ribonucleotide monophosphatase NagD (HAD superfamily)
MTIAVDFDGVLHLYSKGWNGGEIYDEVVPGAKQAMEQLKAAGHKIYIFSTRSNKIFHKEGNQDKLMKDWLEKNEIPFDKIWTFGKPMADLFIDDRAIGFRGNWQQTIKEVAEFKVWNRGDE